MILPVDRLESVRSELIDEKRRFHLLATNIIEKISLPDGVELDKAQRKIFHDFIGQQMAAAGLFIRKHLDYGEGNIRKIGEAGLLSRVIDKIARLENLKGREAVNESKTDAWTDIANYAIIALMVRAGEWEVEPGRSL